MPPGSGWPGDPADTTTPIASNATQVAQLAGVAPGLAALDAAVSVCRACPRLVQWRERVAVEKRRSFASEPYWGRPIAGWGSTSPGVLIVGLAPAANGGNRTGRIFTGDRSGDWLFASLHRVGLASEPTSVHAGDRQRLIGTRMVAAVRCAPPANAPAPLERETCAPWLDAELALVWSSVRSIVCLGSFGWDAVLRALTRRGCVVPRPRPKFGHGVEVPIPLRGHGEDSTVEEHLVTVLGCFHPSQQNTFTGKLTEPMIDAVMTRASQLAS